MLAWLRDLTALLTYLTENCCGRDAVSAPVCDPAAGCCTDATTKTTAAEGDKHG
jgi:hypothetical protein